MERLAATPDFTYELVGEDGELVGEFASVDSSCEVGDLVPCHGTIFEVVAVDGSTCSVRKVL